MPAASGRGVASSGRVAMSEIVPSKSRKMPPRRPSDRSRSTNWSEEIAKRLRGGASGEVCPQHDDDLDVPWEAQRELLDGDPGEVPVAQQGGFGKGIRPVVDRRGRGG